MTAKKSDIPLVDISKENARNIVSAYSTTDKFQILTHDALGKYQRFVSQEDAMALIDEIDVTPQVQSMHNIVSRQLQLLTQAPSNKISYLISDFQKNNAVFKSVSDTTIEFNLLSVQTQQDKNIGVDSVWFEGPMPFFNQNNKLFVKIRNYSEEPADQVKLSLFKDGQEKPINVVDIPPGEAVTDTVSVRVATSGWNTGVVRVTDYPVQFDDDYYFSFYVPDTIKALIISESQPNKYVNALFSGIPYFKAVNQYVNQLQYRQFARYNLIVVNDLATISSGLVSALNTYVREGGKILVFPGANADVQSYNAFLSRLGDIKFSEGIKQERQVSQLNTEEFIFNDVYLNTSKNLSLPKTTYSYPLVSGALFQEEKLALYRDGGSYLSKFNIENGQVFVCTSPLSDDDNDLVLNSEVFVPMIYKIAISSGVQIPISYTIGRNEVITVDNLRDKGDYVYTVSQGTESFIPGQFPSGNRLSLDLSGQVMTSGFYNVTLSDSLVAVVGMNYDRTESDRAFYTSSELKDIASPLGRILVLSSENPSDLSLTISQKDKGIVLWRWFVFLTLLFLALEIVFIRVLSR